MSSATINKINSSAAFAALEEAITGLESATTALARSITRESGAPFGIVQAVWGAQQRLSDACKAAPVCGGNDLWPRVTAAKRVTEHELSRSRRFHEMWKRREVARKAAEGTSGPGPFLPSHVSDRNGKPSAHTAHKAVKSLRDKDIRSRMKGPPRSLDQGHGKKKQK